VFAVLAAGLVTYLLRVSMIVAAGRIRVPAWVDASAELIAPLAFAVLAVTAVAAACLGAGPARAAAPLAAVAVGVVAVLRTGWTYSAVLTGMPTLWLVTALVPAR
jgi:branched-subunit amino acid transport protein